MKLPGQKKFKSLSREQLSSNPIKTTSDDYFISLVDQSFIIFSNVHLSVISMLNYLENLGVDL